jgi:hypothetical protein
MVGRQHPRGDSKVAARLEGILHRQTQPSGLALLICPKPKSML